MKEKLWCNRRWNSLFIITFVGSLTLSSPISALSYKDFYCSEVPLPNTAPIYYDLAVKDCAGKAITQEGVCTFIVHCAHVKPNVIEEIEKLFGRKFAELSTEDKENYFKSASELEWLPSVLSCNGGSRGPTGPVCPGPEQCKGDLYLKIQQATVSPTTLQGLQQRFNEGRSRIFQPSGAAGVAQ